MTTPTEFQFTDYQPYDFAIAVTSAPRRPK